MPVCFADFLNESFFQGLVGNGIANVLAVILGIPAGLKLQQMISARGNRQQAQQLRSALRRCFEHNLGTLATVREQLQQCAAPTFTLDLPLLDSTAATKYDVLNDFPLCASIDHARFEMAHLDRQLDALLQLMMNPMARESGTLVEGQRVTFYEQANVQLVQSINARLPPLEAECRDILARLPG